MSVHVRVFGNHTREYADCPHVNPHVNLAASLG